MLPLKVVHPSGSLRPTLIALAKPPATPLTRDVLALVLREGLALTLLGLVPGLFASLALGKVLSSALYGVRPLEPLILAGLALLLLLVALLACYLPARRATRVDPAAALRRP